MTALTELWGNVAKARDLMIEAKAIEGDGLTVPRPISLEISRISSDLISLAEYIALYYGDLVA